MKPDIRKGIILHKISRISQIAITGKHLMNIIEKQHPMKTHIMIGLIIHKISRTDLVATTGKHQIVGAAIIVGNLTMYNLIVVLIMW